MNSNYCFLDRFSMLPHNTGFLSHNSDVLLKTKAVLEERARPKLKTTYHTVFPAFAETFCGAPPGTEVIERIIKLNMKQPRPYSYHTFMLPFNIGKYGKNSELDPESVVRYFRENSAWLNIEHDASTGDKRKFPFNIFSGSPKARAAKKRTFPGVEETLRSVTPLDGDANTILSNARLAYQEYQYFNPAMRNALYVSSADVSHSFEFRPEGADKRLRAHYYIACNNGITYDLHLNALRVIIFNTGIGIFQLECENHGLAKDGKTSQANMQSVKCINDYGRRINLPLLSDPGSYFSLCADRLDFEFAVGENADGTPILKTFSDNFKEFILSLRSTESFCQNLSLTHVANFITDIMNFRLSADEGRGGIGNSHDKKKSGKVFSSKLGIDAQFLISPALDDRMFVCCCVADEELSKFYTARNASGELNYLCDNRTANDLYEFIFIDLDQKLSCPTAEMRSELLSAHVYKRWLDFKTLHAVTNYSCVCVTGASDGAYITVILPFLIQYTRLACLSLVQRASLIKFQANAAELSTHIENTKKRMNMQTIIALNKLQERFVAFQSQLNLFEVTAQEQGAETYELLRTFMFIDKQQEALQNQLDALYSTANTTLDTLQNKWATILALIALLLSLSGFFSDGIDAVEKIKECKPLLPLIYLFVSVFGVAVPVLISYSRRRRR